MIRQPTPQMRLLKWHRDTIKGLRPPRHEDVPHCGWYKQRAHKQGPWIPVFIWCDQVIDPETGELTEPEVLKADVWGEDGPVNLARIWTFLRPISRQQYDDLVQYRMDNQHWLRNTTNIANTEPTAPKE